jgi:hypothetical protein
MAPLGLGFRRLFLCFECFFQPSHLGDQRVEGELLLRSHRTLGLGHEEATLEELQLLEISLIGGS